MRGERICPAATRGPLSAQAPRHRLPALRRARDVYPPNLRRCRRTGAPACARPWGRVCEQSTGCRRGVRTQKAVACSDRAGRWAVLGCRVSSSSMASSAVQIRTESGDGARQPAVPTDCEHGEKSEKLRVPLDAIFGAHEGPPRPMAAPPTVRKRLGLRGRGSAPLSGPPGAVSPPSRTRTNQLFSIPWYTY